MGVRLFVGGHAGTVQGEREDLAGDRCYSARHQPQATVHRGPRDVCALLDAARELNPFPRLFCQTFVRNKRSVKSRAFSMARKGQRKRALAKARLRRSRRNVSLAHLRNAVQYAEAGKKANEFLKALPCSFDAQTTTILHVVLTDLVARGVVDVEVVDE